VRTATPLSCASTNSEGQRRPRREPPDEDLPLAGLPFRLGDAILFLFTVQRLALHLFDEILLLRSLGGLSVRSAGRRSPRDSVGTRGLVHARLARPTLLLIRLRSSLWPRVNVFGTAPPRPTGERRGTSPRRTMPQTQRIRSNLPDPNGLAMRGVEQTEVSCGLPRALAPFYLSG